MKSNLKVAIGCDEAAIEMKDQLKAHMEAQGIHVTDYSVKEGETALYPDIAYPLAVAIKDKKHDFGVLCCGTGIGMAITANKVRGIRAAQAHDTYSAERARKSNNSQIVTIGARVIGVEVAKNVVDAFLKSEFDSNRSGAKVDRITHYENLGE